MIKFDDPPGSSSARFIISILHGLETVQNELSNDLKDNLQNVGIGGIYSGAYTDETYAILIFALGGLAGGVLGAIGQDIWNAIKESCRKIFQHKGAKRNVLEVVINFENIDVILHFENRQAMSLPKVLDNADSILSELKQVMQEASPPIKSAKTIELRQIPGEESFNCVLHSYRKVEEVLNNLTKKPLDNGNKNLIDES